MKNYSTKHAHEYFTKHQIITTVPGLCRRKSHEVPEEEPSSPCTPAVLNLLSRQPFGAESHFKTTHCNPPNVERDHAFGLAIDPSNVQKGPTSTSALLMGLWLANGLM